MRPREALDVVLSILGMPPQDAFLFRVVLVFRLNGNATARAADRRSFFGSLSRRRSPDPIADRALPLAFLRAVFGLGCLVLLYISISEFHLWVARWMKIGRISSGNIPVPNLREKGSAARKEDLIILAMSNLLGAMTLLTLSTAYSVLQEKLVVL
ncbi:hypothetical protein NL676_028394 [Syzygium grande]|nr:hypothetical protein NL676_028394 [Syzygium grande]